MKPFTRIHRDAEYCNALRHELWALSDDYFQSYFKDKHPKTMEEKRMIIELEVEIAVSNPVFQNDFYQVEMVDWEHFTQLIIQRHDGGRVRDKSHFQQIKDELIGPEYEAVELFPAESRLCDRFNQYHLWVPLNRKARFNLGLICPVVVSERIGHIEQPICI